MALKSWKIYCVGLVEQNHDKCGRFVGMCNLWQNFCGMSMENFLWIWYFGYKNIFVGYVMLDHEKFVWLWFWICRNFCDCTWTWLMWEFFWWHGYGKILVVVYGHVKNFGCGKIWWGFDFLVCGTLTFLGTWEFFGHVVLGMRIFWTCDLVMGIFFGHVILVLRIFSWTWGFGYGHFFGHVILGMGIFCHGIFLIMWKL